MDASNSQQFASKESLEYWKEVDLYIGGSVERGFVEFTFCSMAIAGAMPLI